MGASVTSTEARVFPPLRAVSDAQPPQRPRVFDADACRRLAQISHAIRRLRGFGIHAIAACADPRSGGPWVRIERRPDASIAALLDIAGRRTYLNGSAWCQLGPVMVIWEEKP